MPIQGLRGTDSFDVTQGIRPKNFREGILHLWPNGTAPLTALTAVMKSEAVDDPEFSWFEKAFPQRRVALGDNVAGSPAKVAGDADSLVLTGTNAFMEIKLGQMLMLEQTAEVVRVTATPASNAAVAVIRGIGLTAGASLTAITFAGAGVNPNILVVGTAFAEGAGIPPAVAYDPSKKRNYTQIFRTPLGFTRTGMKTRLRTGDQVKEARREALEMHSVDMERSFLFGKPSELADGGNGHPLRTTGGIYYFITNAGFAECVQSFGGTVTMMELETALEALFRYGSSEKMGFFGSAVSATSIV